MSRTRGRVWTDAEIASLHAGFSAGMTIREVARLLGRTIGQVQGRSRRDSIHFKSGRGMIIKAENPASVEGRTLFPSRVFNPSHPSHGPKDAGVLKSGDNDRKLGRLVTKGRWDGMPIFSLTLEERATCPRACRHWLSCYGNNMQHSKRYSAGTALIEELLEELFTLNYRHPRGFVVRLHVLGDFYSPKYVEAWGGFLRVFPALHVFGYTAWEPDTEIGRNILHVRSLFRGRFEVRFSGIETTTVPDANIRSEGVVVCPAQTGRTRNCGTCGLCWTADRVIGFVQH